MVIKKLAKFSGISLCGACSIKKTNHFQKFINAIIYCFNIDAPSPLCHLLVLLRRITISPHKRFFLLLLFMRLFSTHKRSCGNAQRVNQNLLIWGPIVPFCRIPSIDLTIYYKPKMLPFYICRKRLWWFWYPPVSEFCNIGESRVYILTSSVIEEHKYSKI